MADPFDSASPQEAAAGATALGDTIDALTLRTDALTVSSARFSGAMARAFASAAVGGRAFEDVLKSLALRMSSLALADAVKPLTAGLGGGLGSLFAGLLPSGGGPGLAAAMGAIKPFAAGGVIGTPTYFPLRGGGLGLAGEAGPEAILPLARGPDGRLGVAAGGHAAPTITVTIATPDAASFRRSEAYLTGQAVEVKSHRVEDGGVTLELWQAMPEPLAAGDSFVVTAGCDKHFDTCSAKFDNAVNFRGFPHIPGNDFIISYPVSGEPGHDGGSLQS